MKISNKSLCFLIFCTINSGFGYFSLGYSLGIFNTTQNHLAKVMNIPENKKSLFYSLGSMTFLIGGIIGSTLFAKISSYLGRRNGLIFCSVVAIISELLMLLANSILFYVGRFFSGLSSFGFATISPVYIKEISPLNYSGFTGYLGHFFLPLGILISFAMGLNLPDENNVDNNWWRFMLGFPIIVNILMIFCLFVFFNFETPYYIYKKYYNKENKKKINDFDINCNKKTEINENEIFETEVENIIENKENLQNLQKLKNVSLNEKKVLEKLQFFFKKLYQNEKDIQTEINLVINQIKNEKEKIIQKEWRFQLFLGFLIQICFQFGGIQIMTMYSNLILLSGQKSISHKTATFFTTMNGVFEIVANLIGIFLIIKLGRKSLLMFSLISMCICLFIMSIFWYEDNPNPQKYIMLAYFFLFGIGIDSLTFVIPADMLPEIGCGLTYSFNSVIGIVLNSIFPFLVESNLKIQGSFIILGSVTFFSILLIAIYLPETKGKSFEEIKNILKKKKIK